VSLLLYAEIVLPSFLTVYIFFPELKDCCILFRFGFNLRVHPGSNVGNDM
jgi:hypothetical protein